VTTWFVFDPSPEPAYGPGPKLFGPFDKESEADEYANLLHDEDGSGDTVVVQRTTP
jgi:hypothetical protein